MRTKPKDQKKKKNLTFTRIHCTRPKLYEDEAKSIPLEVRVRAFGKSN